MGFAPINYRRRVFASCTFAVLAAVSSAGLLMAATLAPAPTAVLPLVAALCIGCPMYATWALATSIAALVQACPGGGTVRRQAQAIKELRRALDALPETRHPLGF
jgi:hypothetical protein